MAIGVDEAQLLGIFLQSVVYGLYLPTLFLCLRCLVWENSRFRTLNTIHWPIFLSTIILWVASTLGLALGMRRSYLAFMQCVAPGETLKVISSVSDWANLTKLATAYVTIFVGDGILIYRCWIVWGKRYLIILVPLLLWFADISCAVVATWISASTEANSLISASKLKPFLLTYLSLTIPLNVITTSLIVVRIWIVDRQYAKCRNYSISSSEPRPSALQNVIRIIIESGLLYTASTVVTFCVYLTDSNGFYTSSDLKVPIIGIAFNLIVIRAHKQSADEYTTHSSRTIQFAHTSQELTMETNEDMISGQHFEAKEPAHLTLSSDCPV